MKRIIFLFSAAFCTCFELQAPTVYRPRNVKTAFKNRTRDINDKPGPPYWQNSGNYTIDLTLSPPERTVKGSGKITCFNDSPDTLKAVVFRLTMNYHRPGAERANGLQFPPNVASTQHTSGMRLDHFEVNGEQRTWPAPGELLPWQNVPLPEFLLPGDSVHFFVQWHYDITPAYVSNRRALREGAVDPTTWYLAYFYPRVNADERNNV